MDKKLRDTKQYIGWDFIDNAGTFRLKNPQNTSYLYFPLVNNAGMMSAITPTGNGDVKTGQNTFLTLPVSVEDLHTSRAGRNFWLHTEAGGAWSVVGESAKQRISPDEVTLEAGLLWHKTVRRHPSNGLVAEVVNFVPASDHQVELMSVTVRNDGDTTVTVTPTAAIPIFGRSADNLRDHRHVTSLLHRTRVTEHGVLVKPTLAFDERGHLENEMRYGVFGVGGNGEKPVGFFPIVEDFIGEGGTLDWATAVVGNMPPTHVAGDTVDGYEAMGGIRFADTTLAAGESVRFVLLLAVLEPAVDVAALLAEYGSGTQFDVWLAKTSAWWADKLATTAQQTGSARFDGWMRWVAVQPTLRRLFGNSFLPYHDYGRGGRGWRDLWQDILALLLMEGGDVAGDLAGNFAGIRADGSNATIIGSEAGDFKADRNNIPRVWMDHGAWPLLTTQLYIHQSGDLGFLLREQPYFKDGVAHRTKAVDAKWTPAQGTQLRTATGDVYSGTVLEHLLVQHLTVFFHVGEHNLIKLEGADWNDGLDMAEERGESVAFSALYAGNFHQIATMIETLSQKMGVETLALATELTALLDTQFEPVDYEDIGAKHGRLSSYFESCRHTVSGDKIAIGVADLVADLRAKGDWLSDRIRQEEWVQNGAGHGWFNGYYNNDGERVEGDHANGVRMTLTGQVFTLMGGIATPEQAGAIVKAADAYLYDAGVGGYRLNSDFKAVRHNLGRAFGFAFGHKENGAMFSHMAVMYGYALYERGLVDEGFKVLDGIYQHSQDFAISRMYPGIPEYMSDRGRGMYPFLTGSASWYLLALVTQVFGVRGQWGDLLLAPQLVAGQFDEGGNAGIQTLFAGKRLKVVYENLGGLGCGDWEIAGISMAGNPVPFQKQGNGALVRRQVVADCEGDVCELVVRLG